MKKILVTGAQGFLGQRIFTYYASCNNIIKCGHKDMDITDIHSVNNLLSKYRPDVVIHCAALSDTGYSEQHPDESETVNLQGAVNVALACQAIGCKLIYMSSDQVYNGNRESGPLPEDINLFPVNVYGKHKLEAEKQIRVFNPDAVGLRLTWMYDLPESPYKLNRNILVNLLYTSQRQEEIHVAVHEHRGITNVWDVVKRLESCFRLPGGVYNFGCGNRLNSYETFLATARLMGLPEPEKWIVADYERFTMQPRNLVMDTDKLHHFGIDFPDTLDGLRLTLL